MSSSHIKGAIVTLWHSTFKTVDFNRRFFMKYKTFFDIFTYFLFNIFCLECRLYILKNCSYFLALEASSSVWFFGFFVSLFVCRFDTVIWQFVLVYCLIIHSLILASNIFLHISFFYKVKDSELDLVWKPRSSIFV